MVRATLRESEIRRAIGLPAGGDLVVNGVAALEAAEDGVLSFINHELSAGERDALRARKRCIFIAPAAASLTGMPADSRVLEVSQPRAAIARVLSFVRAERRAEPWLTTRSIAANAVVSPHAVLAGNVHLADGVVIEAFCTIGPDASIGRDTIVRAGARIGERVIIGERCVIGPNTVVGEEGYGFVRGDDGNKQRIPHLGGIVIGSDVEIDALSVIQYGTIDPTRIEDHAKLGMMIGVGHNARIGRGASLTAGIIVGGSADIGEEVWMGVNSTVRNGRRVGARSLVGMDASIQRDVADRSVAVARPAHLGKRSAEDDASVIGFTDRSIEAGRGSAPAKDPASADSAVD